MHPMRAFIRDVVRLGVRALLRRHRFKRPGGGKHFVRPRGPLTQHVQCHPDWYGGTVTLHVWTSQRLGAHELWSGPAGAFGLDLRHGDAGDTGVAVGHWLEKEVLPLLEVELDLIERAHAYEKRETTYLEERMQECVALWELLGRPAEAARARAAYLEGWDDAPF